MFSSWFKHQTPLRGFERFTSLSNTHLSAETIAKAFNEEDVTSINVAFSLHKVSYDIANTLQIEPAKDHERVLCNWLRTFKGRCKKSLQRRHEADVIQMCRAYTLAHTVRHMVRKKQKVLRAVAGINIPVLSSLSHIQRLEDRAIGILDPVALHERMQKLSAEMPEGTCNHVLQKIFDEAKGVRELVAGLLSILPLEAQLRMYLPQDPREHCKRGLLLHDEYFDVLNEIPDISPTSKKRFVDSITTERLGAEQHHDLITNEKWWDDVT